MPFCEHQQVSPIAGPMKDVIGSIISCPSLVLPTKTWVKFGLVAIAFNDSDLVAAPPVDPKFAVGQRVRVVMQGRSHGWPGEILQAVRFPEGNGYWIKSSKTQVRLWFFENELEAVNE